jgi:alpha-ketoglutarate-dependent taurine dioxygenase
MADSMAIEPLKATFGAVVTGIRLQNLTPAEFDELQAAWLRHGLLVFPQQHLSVSEQTAFARRFGELEFDPVPISNVRRDGSVRQESDDDDVIKILKGNMGWHADSTYMPVQAKGAVFSAEVVPPTGGETAWADMRAAYDALDAELRDRVDGLAAYHSLHYSQARLGYGANAADRPSGYGFHDQAPPLRPLVKVHPDTGRPALLIGRHAFGIPGMPPQASAELLDELLEFACQPPRIYCHHWSPGDAVLWDNRCLLHRACPWDMRLPRVMHHARIAGDPVSEFAPSRSAPGLS